MTLSLQNDNTHQLIVLLTIMYKKTKKKRHKNKAFESFFCHVLLCFSVNKRSLGFFFIADLVMSRSHAFLSFELEAI